MAKSDVYVETAEAIELQLVAQRAWKTTTEFQIKGLSQLLESATLMLSGIEAHEMALELKLASGGISDQPARSIQYMQEIRRVWNIVDLRHAEITTGEDVSE